MEQIEIKAGENIMSVHFAHVLEGAAFAAVMLLIAISPGLFAG